MRLGDLDALKEEMNRPFWEKWEWEFICKSIDNAPTVAKDYDTGYQDGLADGLNDIRTQGKWLKSDIPESILAKCSICGFDCGAYTYNFCPNCGAEMGGEGNAKT